MDAQVPKIEGITPDMLWIFMVVLVGLMALIVLGDKVMDVFRNAKKRKKDENDLNGQDVTDRIANKVMEKLTPQIDEKFNNLDKRFEEIDKKLASDQETLKLHTSQLNAHADRVNRLDNDSKALCHGVFALLSHEINGNSVDKLTKAHSAMQNYLIDGIYKEDDWK